MAGTADRLVVACLTCGKYNRLPTRVPDPAFTIRCGGCKSDLGHAAKHAYEENACSGCGGQLGDAATCATCDVDECAACGSSLNADGECVDCGEAGQL